MSTKRLIVVDSLRGFALAGVALVHILEQYAGGPLSAEVMEGVDQGIVDGIIRGFVGTFFIGKFFALFSILFGLSFYLQMDSANQRGESFSGRFLWRAVLLFFIGLVHQIFYRGDILTIYALLTPFLIPFYRMQTKWVLIVSGISFFSLFKLGVFAINGSDPIFCEYPFMNFDNPQIDQYTDLVQSGSFLDLAYSNLTYGMQLKMDFQIGFMGRLYYTFGYFLLGMLLGRIGLFKDLPAFTQYRKKTLLYTLGFMLLAVALTGGLFSQVEQPIDWSQWLPAIAVNFSDWINIAITIFILIGFLSWYNTSSGSLSLNVFVPYGKMALTNYVMQSIIGTSLLFDWGLGLFGTLRAYQLLLLAIVLIAVQILFSKIWLNSFKYGPLEWLWRSLTYLKWQPMKK